MAGAPPPHPGQPLAVQSAMGTADRVWRIEVAAYNGLPWFRLIRGLHVAEWLTLGEVEYRLALAGADLARLIEVPAT